MPAPSQSPIWKYGSSAGIGLTVVLVATFAFTAMRAIGIFGPAGLRWLLPLGFLLMAVAPWALLNQRGRNEIGLTLPSGLSHYTWATVVGALAAITCFFIGYALFGTGEGNWFMSTANYYYTSLDTTGFTIVKLHLVFTLPALAFSPIGEEIFFRGLLQRALEEQLSIKSSTIVECAVFGVVHLCHHGLLFTAAGITILPFSAGIWVILMFSVALLFAWHRRRSGSLYPAIVSHSSFNLTMNIIIFSVLWRFVH